MTDVRHQALEDRVAAVRDEVREAHARFAAGDAAGCGWRARTAVEGMLLVLCEVHGVRAPASPKEGTLGALRKALQHAGVLGRKLQDHLGHIQNIGNRAAHAQPDAHLEVDLDEARSVLPSLDRAFEAFVEQLPPELARVARGPEAAPGRRGWLLGAALVCGLPVSALAAFVGVVVLLSSVDGGARAAPEPEPEAPLVSVADLEALLGDSDPAEVEPTAEAPFDVAVGRVRAGASLEGAPLETLSCAELGRVRGWLWARRGYVFRSADARAWFEAQEGYVRRPDATRRDVERLFTPTDAANLEHLNDRMGALGCACPRPLKRRAPCPE